MKKFVTVSAWVVVTEHHSPQSEQTTKLKEELAAPLRVMQETARRIAKVSKESKLPIVEDEYVSSFKVELMDAVMQWCRGASFAEICKVC
jgi:ATP-dependent RNA helicase DOB1